MTTASIHPSGVEHIQIRVPGEGYPFTLRRSDARDPEVVLRKSDAWRTAWLMEDLPPRYELSLPERNGFFGSTVLAHLPLYGGRGSLRFAWDHQQLEIRVKRYGEWVILGIDDSEWIEAFGEFE